VVEHAVKEYGKLTAVDDVSFTVAAGTLLPLALIWFPEFLGGMTGWGTRARVDQPSPPRLVAAAGWVLLLGLTASVLF
jgi:hypothetical protein